MRRISGNREREGRSRAAARAGNPCDAPAGPAATSISWRVNAERIVLLGWGRAILLQLAHPLIAAGVFDHSDFQSSPWSTAARLHHTVHAMLSLTFGDGESRQRTLDAICAIHRRVNGVLGEPTGPYPAGTPYSAEDPALVLWVHATLVESVLLAYEQFVAPLTPGDRDAYCAEARPVAIALAARPDDVPDRWAGLRAYLDRMYVSGGIVVGTQGRTLAHAVLGPRGAWLIPPLAWANRTITVGLLPPAIREQYALSWTARDARSFGRLVSTMRLMRRVSPDAVAWWPNARIPSGTHAGGLRRHVERSPQ